MAVGAGIVCLAGRMAERVLWHQRVLYHMPLAQGENKIRNSKYSFYCMHATIKLKSSKSIHQIRDHLY